MTSLNICPPSDVTEYLLAVRRHRLSSCIMTSPSVCLPSDITSWFLAIIDDVTKYLPAFGRHRVCRRSQLCYLSRFKTDNLNLDSPIPGDKKGNGDGRRRMSITTTAAQPAFSGPRTERRALWLEDEIQIEPSKHDDRAPKKRLVKLDSVYRSNQLTRRV